MLPHYAMPIMISFMMLFHFGEFMAAGGCNEMFGPELEKYIPKGCNHCGDEALDACQSNVRFIVDQRNCFFLKWP